MTPDERLAQIFPAYSAEDEEHMRAIDEEATRFFMGRCHTELKLMAQGRDPDRSGYPGWWGRATGKVG